MGVLLVISTVVLGAAGDQDPEAARRALPLAKINGRPLTVGYFEIIAAKQNVAELSHLATRNGQQAFLERLIDEELQAAEAVGRGYDKHAELQLEFKTKLAGMMEMVIGANIGDVAVTQTDMRRYYDAHLEDYNRPEMVRARHIAMRDRARAQKLLDAFLKRPPSEAEFIRGDPVTGRKGLSLGFLRREARSGDEGRQPVASLVEAAFTLTRDGEICESLIASEHGFHILMRTGHRPAAHISFEEAQKRGLEDLTKNTLRKRKKEAAIEALKERFKVAVFEENLDYLKIPQED